MSRSMTTSKAAGGGTDEVIVAQDRAIRRDSVAQTSAAVPHFDAAAVSRAR
jgi:hypothetical protein